MISKLFIMFIFGFSGAMIGFYFFRRLKDKVLYFDELIGYCDYLISDIGFRQQPIGVLTEQYLAKSKSSFGQTLREYSKYLQGDELKISKKNTEEEIAIKEFFQSLGNTDAETQVAELKNYKSKFSAYLQKSEKLLNAHGKNYVKLGFLFGLILGILFI